MTRAAALFVVSARCAVDHFELVEEIERSHPEGIAVPPTLYGTHSGPAVAAACFGLIFVVLAFRRRSPARTAPHPSRARQ